MRVKLSVICVLLLSFAFSGCTVARIYATSGNQIALTDLDGASTESFKIKHRIMFDYTSAIDIQELLRERFGSGRRFENVTVKLTQDPADVLLNVITLGIAASKTFEISGDAIRK